MRVAVGSDERTEVTDALVAELEARGHEPVLIGPLTTDPAGPAMPGRKDPVKDAAK